MTDEAKKPVNRATLDGWTLLRVAFLLAPVGRDAKLDGICTAAEVQAHLLGLVQIWLHCVHFCMV